MRIIVNLDSSPERAIRRDSGNFHENRQSGGNSKVQNGNNYGIATVSAPAGVAIAPQTPCVEGPVH